ncbi:30S ribosomal protein S19 [Candidatus Woesearchaeota archaeon]|nr:30S ribosomal protein S19 [Candidatus Woesearchaeota archaeon]
MAKKEQLWRGKAQEELKSIDLKDFARLISSRERRKIRRGFTDMEKTLLKNIEMNVARIRTHCRDMIIIPQMIGKTIHVFNGKEFVQVQINYEMLGHRLGEFALTRKAVTHSAPGIGATRSSAAISVK